MAKLRLGIVFFACLSLSSYLLIPKSSKTSKEIESLQIRVASLIPGSAFELKEKLEAFRKKLDDSLDHIISIPENLKDFSNTIDPLIEMGNELVEKLSAISNIPDISHDQALNLAFYAELQSLQKLFAAKASSLFCSILAVLKEGSFENLSSYQRYYLAALIDKLCEEGVPISTAQKKELLSIKSKLLEEKAEPFVYKQGRNDPMIKAPHTLKIFTLNTCFMPGGLSLLFGGMRSWEERIDEMVGKMLLLDADVLCLQEVHDEKAAAYLFEKLKEKFGYFYMNIGPKVIGLSMDDIGLNSGLFVASKYPVENPYFGSFIAEGRQSRVNKGFFYFTLKAEQGPLAHIVTCHLEPFSASRAPQIREKELGEMLEYIIANEKDPSPVVVCGDFNIPWGKYEPGQYLMEEFFFDPFNEGREDVDPSSRTCTTFFNEAIAAKSLSSLPKEGSSEILDYVLLLKSQPRYVMTTERIPFFDVHHPECALSDHNGLLSTLSLKKR